MPNRNYIKGRKKEYKIMNDERELGNIVLRSAGSHSIVDVVSIDVKARVVKFIQCKPDNISEFMKKRLRLEARELNNMFRCEFVLR